jgi:hypothetical protein
MTESLALNLSSYVAGFKRNVASLKQRGLMDIEEGHAPISFAGLVIICREILCHVPEGRSSNWLQS